MESWREADELLKGKIVKGKKGCERGEQKAQDRVWENNSFGMVGFGDEQ